MCLLKEEYNTSKILDPVTKIKEGQSNMLKYNTEYYAVVKTKWEALYGTMWNKICPQDILLSEKGKGQNGM